MNTIEAPKITAASLWASIKSRAKIKRLPYPQDSFEYVFSCSCYITIKQGDFLRSLCEREGACSNISDDKFALESGIGLMMSPSKYGYLCQWSEYGKLLNNERKS